MARRRLTTQKQYAREIGVSAPRVSAMKKEGKLRMVGRQVDLDTSLQLHQERLAAQQRSPARQVKDHYDAKMAKLTYEKASEQVVEVAAVRCAWERSLIAAKTSLLGLGRHLAPRLVNLGVLQIQSVIDGAVIDALKRLAHPEYYPEEQFVKDCDLSPNKEAL